jgi:hypothetical protein
MQELQFPNQKEFHHLTRIFQKLLATLIGRQIREGKE